MTISMTMTITIITITITITIAMTITITNTTSPPAAATAAARDALNMNSFYLACSPTPCLTIIKITLLFTFDAPSFLLQVGAKAPRA